MSWFARFKMNEKCNKVIYNFFIFIFFILSPLGSGAELDDVKTDYLDTYIVSMASDLRGYKLMMDLSSRKNHESDEYLIHVIEMKLYDLNNYLPLSSDAKAVSLACKFSRVFKSDNLFDYRESSKGIDVEIERLLAFCYGEGEREGP